LSNGKYTREDARVFVQEAMTASLDPTRITFEYLDELNERLSEWMYLVEQKRTDALVTIVISELNRMSNEAGQDGAVMDVGLVTRVSHH